MYYYGARYLNPRISRWASADPAGFDLINPMEEGKAKGNYSIIEGTNWYSYVSNNPVKYVDPDGEFGVIGPLVLAVVALALNSSCLPENAPIDTQKVQSSLFKLGYDDGKNKGKSIGSGNTISAIKKMKIASNPAEVVSVGLPRGTPGANDYSDGKTSTIGTVMGVVGLGTGILGNSSDGKGNFVGDVSLNIEKTGGLFFKKATSWNLTETKFNPIKDEVITGPMPELDAKQFINNNKESLKARGVYEFISKQLDVD